MSAATEAEIRIAQGIADSPLASSDLGALARAATDPTADDQLTGLRGPLVRNWTIIVATSAMTSAAQGVVGNASYDALHWVVAHGDDILAMARSWGEPVLAWVAPIVGRAREMAEAGRHVARGWKSPQS